MGKVLSQQQIDQFRDDGFVAPVDVISEDEAADYVSEREKANRNWADILYQGAS